MPAEIPCNAVFMESPGPKTERGREKSARVHDVPRSDIGMQRIYIYVHDISISDFLRIQQKIDWGTLSHMPQVWDIYLDLNLVYLAPWFASGYIKETEDGISAIFRRVHPQGLCLQ